MDKSEVNYAFEGPAVLEILGHKIYAGHVAVSQIMGVPLIEVTLPPIPDEKVTDYRFVDGKGSEYEKVIPGEDGYQKYFALGAVYCITPMKESEMLKVAIRHNPRRATMGFDLGVILEPESTDPDDSPF